MAKQKLDSDVQHSNLQEPCGCNGPIGTLVRAEWREGMHIRRIGLFTMTLFALSVGQAGAQTLGELFKRVNPAVAVIYTAERTVVEEAPDQLVNVGGIGSGFLFSDKGEVITAAHVVQAADRVVVEFANGERIRASVVSSNPSADVALLQLESRPAGVVPVRLGDSDLVEVGDEVFIIGAPLGVSHTLTVGHVSARRHSRNAVGGLINAELLQTDAAINQGNSGGPMFNMNGEVIGIVSHIISQTGGFTGLGFVITSNVAREILLERPPLWSGVDIFNLTEDLGRILNVPAPHTGMLVQRVAQGSLGERLGLKGGTIALPIPGSERKLILGGDIVLSIQGVRIDGTEEALDRLDELFSNLRPGSPITLLVLRAGEQFETSVQYSPQIIR
jgi:S1-C subfamily serine protease